jgi:hypothetical protein
MTEKDEITLPKRYQPNLFQKIFQYFYSGKLKLSEKDINEIILLSEYFGLKELQNECFLHFSKLINNKNCFEILSKYDNGKFEFQKNENFGNLILDFISKNFHLFNEEICIQNISLKNIFYVIDSSLLSFDEYNLYLFLEKWCLYNKIDKEERKKLMKLIRWPLIDTINLLKIYDKSPLDLENEMYVECLEYTLKPSLHKDKLGLKRYTERHKLFDSVILSSYYSNILNDLIDVYKNKEYKLIYRATKNGFGGNDFRNCCNGASKTIVIIKSSNGNIFGGYTPW